MSIRLTIWGTLTYKASAFYVRYYGTDISWCTHSDSEADAVSGVGSPCNWALSDIASNKLQEESH